MVQEFHVLRCFSCQTFQVQQVKKTKKWSCKMCGEKQSLVKEFGQGSSLDCRRHVQRLNAMRGQMIDEQTAGFMWQEPEDGAAAAGEDRLQQDDLKNAEETLVSRWSKYLDTSVGGRGQEEEEEESDEGEENVCTDRRQLYGKRKRKRRDERRDGGHSCASGTSSQRPVQRNTATIALPPRGEPITPPGFSQPVVGTESSSTSYISGADPGYTSSTSRPNISSSRQPRPTGIMTASKWTPFLSFHGLQEEPSAASGSCGEPVGGMGGASGVMPSSRLKAVIGICQSEEQTTEKAMPTPMLKLPLSSEAVSQQTPPTRRLRATLSFGSMFSTGEDFDDVL